MFGRDDWTLFRNISTLGQKAGVPRHKLAALVLKELADNALDAGARCELSVMPDGWYRVADDGPGIDGDNEEIARLFSIRRPLSSTKLFRLPMRGALGNGLRVVAGAVLACGGGLRVRTRGRWLTLRPMDDGHTSVVDVEPAAAEGTAVEVRFAGELAVSSDRTLSMARAAVAMRGVSKFEGKTNPWWYDSDSFFEMLNAAGGQRLGDLLDNVAGMRTGMLMALPLASDEKPYRAMRCEGVTRAQAEAILAALREGAKPAKPSVLGEVGAFTMPSNGYAKKVGSYKLAPGVGKLGAELPAVVEVWATRVDDRPACSVFVNRTPVTADVNTYAGGAGHRAETSIFGCGLRHYFKTGRQPMSMVVCVTTPYMAITTDGKEPNLEPLFGTIAEAVAAACRKARLPRSEEGRPASKRDIILGSLDEAVAKASGGGEHRFSLRQLFYAVRPFVLEAGGEEPDYGYFSSVIGEWEKERGPIRGIYRDARGVLYHPHTGETIALGTLNVEKYRRPEYRFNKVLYVEKGGFFELLKDARWPERHDCALMTSQGFASGAARDLLDLIGDTDEEMLFFCVHDADGPGTGIYQALVEETKSRRALRVKVINLGLDPAEAVGMGLATEKVERKKGKVPVADYIKDGPQGWKWEEWLQSTRVELNSMTSPQFLRWLDGKMEDHDRLGKVLPPRETMADALRVVAEKKVREAVVARILASSDLEAQVRRLMLMTDLPGEWDLADSVREHLKYNRAVPWEKPLEEIAEKAVREAVR